MIPLWLATCYLLELTPPPAAAESPRPVPVCRFEFGPADDQDLDDQPDDWVRRKGPGFPKYVRAGIDHSVGRSDQRSLRIQANGGAALFYSPFIRVDGLHTYYFEGFVRTEGLRHDAALVSVSLLNAKRERVQRFVTRPALGDHRAWTPLTIGPIIPQADVRFAVIGCHLALGQDDVHDISGAVWFDDLSLGRLPRMELESNFIRHFLNEGEPIHVTCNVSGLDEGHAYDLELRLLDAHDAALDSKRFHLEPDAPTPTERDVSDFQKPHSHTWELPRQAPGFYKVQAKWRCDGQPVAEQATSLAVMRLVDKPRAQGEFGWSLQAELSTRELAELPQVAAQAGVNWLKYPLWQSIKAGDPQRAGEVATMFDQLGSAGIVPVAVLADPPPAVRNKFAKNWAGVSEIFHLPPTFWRAALDPVVARYSSNVHHWQLGGDDDRSFLGMPGLAATLANVRQEVRKISLNASVGIPWDWEHPLPSADAKASFVSLPLAGNPDDLPDRFAAAPSAPQKWVVLRPDELTGDNVEERAAHLIRQMVAAKIAGAQAIFVGDAYHERHGLLKPNGAPAELFLPWRTAALALQGTEYLGAFALANGSDNAVFARDGKAVVVLWSAEPTEETLYLGEQALEVDIWGRQRPVPGDPRTGEQYVQAGPLPKLLLNCSEPIARWLTAARFEHGKMRSEYGGHEDAILCKNTFPQGVSGTLTLGLPDEWESEPREWSLQAAAGEDFRFPVYLTLPPNANLGEQRMILDFKISADRPYRFRVYRQYQIGLGDLTLQVYDRQLPDGRLEIEQIVTNRTQPPEVFDFRCNLYVPDSRRQKLQITKLGPGEDRKFYYLPNAEAQRGKTLMLRLEQEGGRRILNHRWRVGADWQPPAQSR